MQKRIKLDEQLEHVMDTLTNGIITKLKFIKR